MTNGRRQEAIAWARTHLPAGSWTEETVSSDASFRSYYRLSSNKDSFVVMDAPPEREPVAGFLDVARRLRDTGLHTPVIHAAEPGLGFVLLEDLGRTPYHHVLTVENADRLFGDAMRALARMQLETSTAGLPLYDEALLQRELALFPDWFLARHWQVEASPAEQVIWADVCELLTRAALRQPQVFCHRDFMPRNLMVSEPNPGIIDFQDAVLGPISYDPVCLFRDAFLSWPETRVDNWLEDYRKAGLAAGLPMPESPEHWQKTCDLMGVQRHLKVIGIFARIRYRDGKPAYLEDTPRFFRYLQQAIARNTELKLLGELLECWRSRSQSTP
ncbi:MAG: phosphotransferase [Wenzhouxiangella sp.]|jgi:aminoglycoside/choline kinase family phosphotransferase|nr:phosphotransferase [Wenzhouxiangella sp.]